MKVSILQLNQCWKALNLVKSGYLTQYFCIMLCIMLFIYMSFKHASYAHGWTMETCLPSAVISSSDVTVLPQSQTTISQRDSWLTNKLTISKRRQTTTTTVIREHINMYHIQCVSVSADTGVMSIYRVTVHDRHYNSMIKGEEKTNSNCNFSDRKVGQSFRCGRNVWSQG